MKSFGSVWSGPSVLLRSLSVCAMVTASSASATETMRIGWTEADTENNAYAMGARYFAEELEALAPEQFNFQYFASNILGNEIEMLQQMQRGQLQAGVITGTQVARIVPSFAINDLPFLYEDNAQAHQALDGELGQELLAQLTEEGLMGLGFTEAGFRNVVNNVRSINHPDDFAGVRLRMQDSELFIETFGALGANPVPMEWSDAFTAVAQGTVDGLEIPIAGIYTNRFYEVTKFLSLTQHAYNAPVLILSKQFYDSLDADLQEAVHEAASRSIKRQREDVGSLTEELIKRLKEEGMDVNSIDDIGPFREAVAGVYETFQRQMGQELINLIPQ